MTKEKILKRHFGGYIGETKVYITDKDLLFTAMDTYAQHVTEQIRSDVDRLYKENARLEFDLGRLSSELSEARREIELLNDLNDKRLAVIDELNRYRLWYEWELPDNISGMNYELWYEHSLVIDGVRMGYRLDWLEANNKI